MATPGQHQQIASQGYTTALWQPADRRLAPPEVPAYTRPRQAIQSHSRRAALFVRDNNSEGASDTFYLNFVLQSWNRTAEEQLQITTNTEGWTPFFYQSKPVMWVFSGIVFDGRGAYDWANDLIEFYEEYLRGPVAAGRFSVVMMTSSRAVQGYIYGMDMAARAPFDRAVNFSLRMVAVYDQALAEDPFVGPPTTAPRSTPFSIDFTGIDTVQADA